MRQIATFFTLYWCIYFPTCIAYNDLPGFSVIDEAMTGLLLVYTLMVRRPTRQDRHKWKEFGIFAAALAFFTVYGLTFGRNPEGVWLDFIQEMRPYIIIYCTWILNPQFSRKQKQLMLTALLATLFSWLIYHPEAATANTNAEFPILGQLAVCAAMGWYLLTEQTRRNAYIAAALILTGMLAPKFKFLGEIICFIALIFFVKRKLRFHSIKSIVGMSLLLAVILYVTCEKFDVYYVKGFTDTDHYRMARPETYKTALKILWDYLPFGSGMGSFACNGAWKHYSPIYYEYHLNRIWGLDPGGGFICDAYYPTLAQFGIVGVWLFFTFWKRRIKDFYLIRDMRYYRVALMAFLCLAIEQTADSSLLSGKGMGYCMIIGLCLNANNQIRRKSKISRYNRYRLMAYQQFNQGSDIKQHEEGISSR